VLFGDRFRGGGWLLLHPKIDRCTQQLRFQAASMGAGSSMDIMRSPSMHRARAFAPSGGHGVDKVLFGDRFRGGGWLLLHPKIDRCTQQLRFQAASMGAGSSMDVIRSPSMHRARAFAPSGGHSVDKVLFGDRFRGGVWLLLHPKIDRCTQQLRFQAASMGAGSSIDVIRSPSMHRARVVASPLGVGIFERLFWLSHSSCAWLI